MADPLSRYIRKSPGADTVIVFVHGIMGDGMSTWTSESDSYWPTMLTTDHTFDGADILSTRIQQDFGLRCPSTSLPKTCDRSLLLMAFQIIGKSCFFPTVWAAL
jgi:hypothetical protein